MTSKRKPSALTDALCACEIALNSLDRGDVRLAQIILKIPLKMYGGKAAQAKYGKPFEALEMIATPRVNCLDNCDGTGPVYPGDYGWMCADCFPMTEAKS